MTAHSEIRIPFEIEEQRLEAVGFLHQGESYVLGDEMLKRVPDALNSEEDWALLSEHRDQFPSALDGYALVTARRLPDCPRDVSCFYRDSYGWYDGWYWLGRDWFGRCLVVRRRT